MEELFVLVDIFRASMLTCTLRTLMTNFPLKFIYGESLLKKIPPCLRQMRLNGIEGEFYGANILLNEPY